MDGRTDAQMGGRTGGPTDRFPLLVQSNTLNNLLISEMLITKIIYIKYKLRLRLKRESSLRSPNLILKAFMVSSRFR